MLASVNEALSEGFFTLFPVPFPFDATCMHLGFEQAVKSH